MHKYATLLCLLLIHAIAPIFATPAQLMIIPHAELNAQGHLTKQGLERAGALPGYLLLTPNLTAYGPPVSLFAARPTPSSPTPPFFRGDDTQACIQTIAPTAQILKLPIHSGFSKLQDSKLATFILNNPLYDGKNVLICWRNESIPSLAQAFGVSCPPSFPPYVDNVAWVITFAPSASLLIYPQDLLAGDTVTLCGCGTVAYPTTNGYATPEATIESPQVWSFVSEPNLHPMKVFVNLMLPGISAGYIMLAPYSFSEYSSTGQQGALMLDNRGNPIYFRPTSGPNLMNTDFRVQQFNGEPVLTFWQGTLSTPPAYTNAPGGSSEPNSCYYILDSTYAVIKTVAAQNGFTSDIHEFLLTPSNSALFLSTKKVPMDLTPYGGPQNGFVQDFAIQEVDLQTNELLFFWDALQHISLEDSFEPASSASQSGNVWDAFHCNSIGLTDSPDDIILSSRNMWTIFRINKPSGNIVWQLGGKQSSFILNEGAQFSWQHDARFLPSNMISMFDDNCCESATIPPGTPYAHGLILQLDLVNMTASAATTYYHNPNINVASQGNVQSLANGNKFIGWGQSQYYSEFAPAGNTESTPGQSLLYDAQMPTNNYTYRAYRDSWVGMPYYPPSIAVVPQSEQTLDYASLVYAAWNGSTETAAWQVFAGSAPTDLFLVASAPKAGFETAIPVASSGPYFQVQALDASSAVLGVSEVTTSAFEN